MTDIDKLRRSKPSGMVSFYLHLLASVVWVAGAYYAASNGHLAIALFFLGPVPFFVASAGQVQQSRINHALLAEIESLRIELSEKPRA